MTTHKTSSCTGWVLATTFLGIGLVILTAMLVYRRYPEMGWLLPALGASIWVSTSLFWLAGKLQREQPVNDIHPLIYFLSAFFTLTIGGFLFAAAVYQPLAH